MRSGRRKLTPESEHDVNRDPRLGCEAPNISDFVRCVEHGAPTPLEHWHCHGENELQLMVGARGRAFVADCVGHAEPGHLVNGIKPGVTNRFDSQGSTVPAGR